MMWLFSNATAKIMSKQLTKIWLTAKLNCWLESKFAILLANSNWSFRWSTKLHFSNLAMPDCQLQICLLAALHIIYNKKALGNTIWYFHSYLFHDIQGTRSRASTTCSICPCLNYGSVFATRKPFDGGKPSSFSGQHALLCNSSGVQGCLQVPIEQSILVWLALQAAQWLGLYLPAHGLNPS